MATKLIGKSFEEWELACQTKVLAISRLERSRAILTF
jgi:hypothetical protein